MNTARQILRRRAVEKITGDPRSTLYAKITKGLFTKPVKLSARSVGWPLDEAEKIIGARIAGKSDAEIKALVASLEMARKVAAR